MKPNKIKIKYVVSKDCSYNSGWVTDIKFKKPKKIVCKAWGQNLGPCKHWNPGPLAGCTSEDKVQVVHHGTIVYCSGNGYRAWKKKRKVKA